MDIKIQGEIVLDLEGESVTFRLGRTIGRAVGPLREGLVDVLEETCPMVSWDQEGQPWLVYVSAQSRQLRCLGGRLPEQGAVLSLPNGPRVAMGHAIGDRYICALDQPHRGRGSDARYEYPTEWTVILPITDLMIAWARYERGVMWTYDLSAEIWESHHGVV